MSNVMNILISDLYSHPDNPRKNLGDLEELSSSIKENGVLQNLTVIPGHYIPNLTREERMTGVNVMAPDGYTVLIGHRRCEAARLAGLDELPCTVLNGTTLAEQIKIMLCENMQRSDITPVEQAESFQTMLDLGATVEEIAKESGFSTRTIRHRINIAKLDKNALAKAQSKCENIRMDDFIALEAVKDMDSRNELLEKHLGTANFEMELKKALLKQKREELIKQWLTVVPTFAEKVDDWDYGKMEWYKDISSYTSNPVEIAVPADSSAVKYFYVTKEDGGVITGITVYKERIVKEQSDSDKLKAEAGKKMDGYKEQLEAMQKLANENRLDFIANIGTVKPYTAEILTYIAMAEAMGKSNYYRGDIARKTYIRCNPITEADKDSTEFYITAEEIQKDCVKNLGKTMLAVAACHLDSIDAVGTESGKIYCVVPKEKNAQNAAKVAMDENFLFNALGYVPSDEEKMLLNGTHPLFAEAKDLAETARANYELLKATEKAAKEVSAA